MLKKLAASALLATSISSAFAAVTINTPDGAKDFGGFDWASTASVWISGYDVLAGMPLGTTDSFDLYYQAYAVAVEDHNGNNVATPGLKTSDTGTGYEYTINAVIHETVTCITAGCTVVQLSVNSGTWDVYFQAAGNAILSGANGGISGILDGTKILSGVFDSTSDSVIGAQGSSNPGNVTLSGTFRGSVTFQDLSVISPALDGTTAVSTLQFGTNVTAWTRPGQFDGLGSTGSDTNSSFVGQADANQSFAQQVPEPATLALVGLAMTGLGLARRRNNKA